jgi:hypothetical protein
VFNYHGCFSIDNDATGAQDRFDRQRTSGEAYPTLDFWLISFWRTKRIEWGGVIQMDPKRPKIQSSWIQMKPVPSCSARCDDFGSIFFFENGLHMRKISRSEVFLEKEKSQQSILLMSAVCHHDMADGIIMMTWKH